MTTLGWMALLYGTVFFSQWFLLKRYGANWLLTIPGIFLVYHIVFNVLGAVYAVHDSRVVVEEAMVRYFFALILGVVVHTIVPPILDWALGRNMRNDLDGFFAAPISGMKDSFGVRASFVIVALAAIGVTFLYLKSLPSVPFLEIFNKSLTVTLAKSRELATNEFAGKYHRYSFYFRTLLPVLALMSMVAARTWKNWFWRIMFVAVVCFTAFMQVADVQKMPLINFLSMLIIVTFIMQGGIDWKKVMWLAVAASVLLVLMYQFIMGMVDQQLHEIVRTIATRLFLAQTKGMYTAFRMFPAHHEFLMGTSLPNPAGLFPYEQFPLVHYLFVNTFGLMREIGGTAPTVYYTEIYCNFGYGPMIGAMFIGSTLLYLFQRVLMSFPKTPLTIGVMGYWIVSGGLVSIMSFLAPFGILFLVFWFHIAGYTLLRQTFDGAIESVKQDDSG